jgi:hypothetical protein
LPTTDLGRVAFATLTDYIQGRVPETDSPRRVAVEVADGNHEPLMAAVLTVGFVPDQQRVAR